MFIWCVGEGMLDLLVPLKGGFVFSAQHFVVLVGGMVQAAELLNSQKCKAPSALWHPRPPPRLPTDPLSLPLLQVTVYTAATF